MMVDVERNHHHQSATYSNHHNHPTSFSNRNSHSCSKWICRILRLARFLPFLLITTLYIWGVHVYLYYVIYSYYEQIWAQALVVTLFVPLYLLSFISYIKCVFAAHRPISSDYYLPESLRLNHMTEDERNNFLEQLIQSRNLPIFTRSYNGYVRYCTKCLVLKPDRAHHCSTCGKCICKMDHHCHWVSNCVAFDNYKFFMLFLFYTSILCVYVAGTSIELFMKFWKDEMYPGKFHVFFLVLFCCIFSMSILILLSYHIYLVTKNVTTLESYQTPLFQQYQYNDYRFNLGYKRNLTSVFGDQVLYWFLPIFNSQGDGHYYPLPLIPEMNDKFSPTLQSGQQNHRLNVCDSSSTYQVDHHHPHQAYNNSPALLQPSHHYQYHQQHSLQTTTTNNIS